MTRHVFARASILSFGLLAALAFAQITTVMTVNDQPVLSTELERIKSLNQLFAIPAKGFVKTDLNNLLVNQLILLAAALQDAGGAQPSEDQIKEHTIFLQSVGYPQADYSREAVIEQLKLTNRIEEIQKSEDVSDQELAFYFELYKNNYALPASIQARQIVVATLKQAQQILKRIKAGENFAALAKVKSLLNSKQDGTIAAKPNQTTPQAITEYELPKVLADAAFRPQKAGVTEIIAFEKRFYIIKIEKFNTERIPSFQETITKLESDGQTNRLRADAQALKSNGTVENWVENLQRDATVSIPEGSNLELYDPVVARVENTNILLSELNRDVYINQQAAGGLSHKDGSSRLRDFFKPQSLTKLMDQSVALELASKLDLPFIGSRADVFDALKRYQGRNLNMTESEAKTFYQNNLNDYKVPARADLTIISFAKQKSAQQFRTALKKPRETLLKLASRFKGRLNDLGTTEAFDVPVTAMNAIFNSKLSASKFGAYTTIIKIDSGFVVYVVQNLKANQSPPFSEIKARVTRQALEAKRLKAGEKLIQDARKTVKLENFLDAVTKESEALGNRKP